MRFFNLDRLRRVGDDVDRGWPGYLLGGRVRTSTVVLIIAFAGLWWVYDDHQRAVESSPKTTQVPATQVVPPGFVPDPNYTWVPRTQVQEPTPTLTVTPTPTTTPSTRPPRHDAAAAIPADCPAPAVRSARHQHAGASAQSGAGTAGLAATARLTLMARLPFTRFARDAAASSPGGLANVGQTHRYTGEP